MRDALPKLTHRFRPKADYDLLRKLSDEAWTEHNKALEAEGMSVGARMVEHLIELYPPEDMVVLVKYGQAGPREQVSVSVYNPETERWDVHTSIPLTSKVVTPEYRNSFFSGGPDYSGNGHSRVPQELDEFFTRIREQRARYKAEERLRVSIERGEDGKYPTWAELAEAMPVTGEYIRRVLLP